MDEELKTLAVYAFRGHRRRCQHQQWRMASVAVVGLALRGPRPWPPAVRSPAAANSVLVHYRLDDELLSQFPPGSCVLVEVDDRKQLVFLDRDLERDHLAGLVVR